MSLKSRHFKGLSSPLKEKQMGLELGEDLVPLIKEMTPKRVDLVIFRRRDVT